MMKLTKIKRIGSDSWEVEGIGTLERDAQGLYVVTTTNGDRLNGDEIQQLATFIQDHKTLMV